MDILLKEEIKHKSYLAWKTRKSIRGSSFWWNKKAPMPNNDNICVKICFSELTSPDWKKEIGLEVKNEPKFGNNIFDKTNSEKLDLIFNVAFGNIISHNLELTSEYGIISAYASNKSDIAEILVQKLLSMNLKIPCIYVYLYICVYVYFLENNMIQYTLLIIEE